MAGSATITGRQNYIMGIGHPKTEATTEAPPAMLSTDSTGKVNGIVGPDGGAVPIPLQSFVATAKTGLLTIGDSFIAGTGAGPTTQISTVLPQLLGASWVNESTSVAAGVSGERSDQILARLPALLAANPSIGACAIMCGANDASQLVASDVYARNVESMILTCISAGVRVLIFSAPPRKSPATVTNSVLGLLTEYRNQAHRLSKKYSIAFADLWSVIADQSTGLLNATFADADGLHPSVAGHWAIANAGATAYRATYPRAVSGQSYEGGPNLIGNSLFLTDLTGWTQSAGGTTGSAFTTASDPYGLLEAGRVAAVSWTSGTGPVTISRNAAAAASDTWAVGDTMVLSGQLYVDDSVMTSYAGAVVTGGALVARLQVLNQSASPIASADIKGGPRAGEVRTEFVVPAGTTAMTFVVSAYNASAGATKIYAGKLRLSSKTKYPGTQLG